MQQSEMNDTHVSIKDLVVSGILWELVYVLNGWAPDPTGEHLFYPAVFPEIDVGTGNPNGAQEWRKQNYCAKNYSCKVRLGNIGGENFDPGGVCL